VPRRAVNAEVDTAGSVAPKSMLTGAPCRSQVPPRKPVAALINIDDLADLEDRPALAVHLAEKAAGRDGIGLDELDAALDRIDADTLS
jgi:hypothetical protein